VRRALASAILRLHVWAARAHQRGYLVGDSGWCMECNQPWPCRVRRETDERVDRFAEVSR
jgi:hypothetical protein